MVLANGYSRRIGTCSMRFSVVAAEIPSSVKKKTIFRCLYFVVSRVSEGARRAKKTRFVAEVTFPQRLDRKGNCSRIDT